MKRSVNFNGGSTPEVCAQHERKAFNAEGFVKLCRSLGMSDDDIERSIRVHGLAFECSDEDVETLKEKP